ncbi:MAG: TfoX/Sxy family protein [Pseudomonadota bacterium]
MPYNPALAAPLDAHFVEWPEITTKRMFGGLCYFLNGNMLCGVDANRYMFRVGKDQEAEALTRPGASPMDITGRPLGGFVFVDPAACEDTERLVEWVAFATAFVAELPPKIPKVKVKP